MSELPCFLLVQVPAGADARDYFDTVAGFAERHGGRVLTKRPSREVECLEQGTPAASILLIDFPDRASLAGSWSDTSNQSAFAALATANPLVLAAPGLPREGLPEMPEIPTTASVTPPAGHGPTAYMLIQGTGRDQERMDRYRDIILPMIAAQGAYYIAFEIEGKTEVLAGDWPYEIFAVSQWPDHAAGHAFWDSDRYQNTAIPVRTGAGEFWVHFMIGGSD